MVLQAPDPDVTGVVASAMQVMRSIADTDPDVQAAIETLKAAVLVWEEEDTTPPPVVPPPDPLVMP
mgnify:CR=1 FL=1